MTEFTINVTEISKGYIKVEANSRAEAKELARESWYHGHSVWKDGEAVFEIAPEEVSV